MLTMDFPGFKVTGAETSGNTICVSIEATIDRSCCPQCGQESRHLHSKYVRHLRDLPSFGYPVLVHAVVRRFRCLVKDRSRKTFSEPLSDLALPHAQRTERVTSLLKTLILATSCHVGTKIAKQMGIETSPRTLFRVVDVASRTVPMPRILGVDDFALRKGQTYGTILCDLETRKPIDILLGRTTGPLVEWLKQHPGIESSRGTEQLPMLTLRKLAPLRPFRWQIASTWSAMSAVR